MIAKSFAYLAASAGIAAAGLALAAPSVKADPWGPYESAAPASVEDLSVRAPHRYIRQPTTGAMVRLNSVSFVVPLGDLDLSSPSGARVAKARIERAAREACDEVQARYPAGEDVPGGCYATAVREGLARAERLAGYPIVAWGYR